MSLATDTIIDRIKLKEQLGRWRALAILAVVVLAIVLVKGETKESPLLGDYIARIKVDGLIQDDQERDNILKGLEENRNVKAVVVHINSPGGTVGGSEILYRRLKKIAKVKPVVAVMESVAASGGYMVAVASNRIYTLEGTLTGSIGVYFQSAEITELSKKIGVTFNTFKSSPLKASPTPFEKVTPEITDAIEALIRDNYDLFLDFVESGRNMPRDELAKLADGRVYTGRQAVKNGLADAIGGEDEAVSWLQKEKGLAKGLPVKEVKLHKEPSLLEQTFYSLFGSNVGNVKALSLHGAMAVWQPAAF